MVTYSAAPLASASVATIEPFAFKALSNADGVYLHRFFTALGFGRVLDARLASLGSVDENVNGFFRNVIAEANGFKEHAGLYISEDIVKAVESSSVIAKISVTDESITEQNSKGGVASFVIPVSSGLNAILVSSGGITAPAYLNGVGVSVLPVDIAFANFAETLYTLTQLVFNNEEESPETNWAEGKNISVTLYRSNGEKVSKFYQLVINDNNGLVCKEAESDEDGYIPITKWADVEPGTHVLSSFVFKAHERLAAALNSDEGKKISLAVIGSEVSSESTVERFRPVFLGENEPLARDDAFGIDQHPVHVEEVVSEVEQENVEYEAQPVTASHEVITEAENVHSLEDLVSYAEYSVTHSEEPAVTSEVNDPSAETSEPFELGAEYLIQESLEEEAREPIEFHEEPVANLEPDLVEDVPVEQEIVPEAEALPTVPEVNFDNLEWSEIAHDDNSTQQEEESEAAFADEFSDLSWDEVALPIVEDGGNDDKPGEIKGFIQR